MDKSTKKLPVIDISHVDTKKGGGYKVKIDGHEIRGVYRYEIHKEKSIDKLNPLLFVSIVIQPEELNIIP